MVTAHRPSESPNATDTADSPAELPSVVWISSSKVTSLCFSQLCAAFVFSVTLFTCLVDGKEIICREIYRGIFMSPTTSFIESKFGGKISGK